MISLVYTLINADYSSSPEWVRRLTMLLILLALLLAGLVAGLGHEGNELSPDNCYYRRYFELLGLRLGRWLPLPPVVGVTLKFYAAITRGNVGNGPTSWGVWDTSGQRHEKFVLLLSLQNSTQGLIIGEFITDELALARQAAQAMAERFGVPASEYLLPQRTGRC